MEFLEEEKNSIAKRLVRDERPAKPSNLLGPKSLEDCRDILIIHGKDRNIEPLVSYFKKKNKSIIIFTVEKDLSKIRATNRVAEKIIDTDRDFNYINIPKKELIKRVREENIDWLINLYDGPGVEKIHFLSAKLPVTMKIGIFEKGFENYYDFMVNKGNNESFDDIINPLLNFAEKIRKDIKI